jgi:hypothetical protein
MTTYIDQRINHLTTPGIREFRKVVCDPNRLGLRHGMDSWLARSSPPSLLRNKRRKRVCPIMPNYPSWRNRPGVPHQLCHFHYLREAAQPVYEADRHAKVQLKKKVRGIRPIERKVEGREGAEAEAIRGSCAAVRSALTDDGRPPLEAAGLKLVDRLTAVAASLDRVGSKRGSPRS